MVIRTMNIKQFANWTNKFPAEMEKVGISINQILAKSYQRRIRSRATGRLKRISAVPKGKLLIEIQYPNKETAKVAEMVNAGRHPGHPIPQQLMDASRAGKETVGRKSRDVIGDLPAGDIIWVQPKMSASKGFLTKAGNTLKQNTGAIIEKELQKVFNAS